jgi:molybdopterin converting factor small subunit
MQHDQPRLKVRFFAAARACGGRRDGMMQIRLVISGRAYHLIDPLPDQLALDEDATVDVALAQLAAMLPPEVRLPASTLVAVANRHLGTLGCHAPHALREGDELLLIVPVAGG